MTLPGRVRPARVPARSELAGLLRLAAPLVAGLAASTGVTLVDTAMLGPLGALPLAGAALASTVILIFYATLYGLAGPVGLFAGQAWGARDAGRLGRVARAGARIALAGGAAGAALMAVGLLLMPLLGQPAEVVAEVGPYWLWMSAMLLPFTLSMVPKYVLDSTDRAWTGVALTLVPVALNIALNWVFIYGNLGAPALGLTGAGVASFLATAIGAAVGWAYVRFAPAFAAWWAEPEGVARETRLQVREGLPMATQYFLEGGSFAVAGVLVGLFGAIALAGNQIVLSVSATLYMLPLGMSAAVSIRVAQALGGGEPARVRAIGVAGLAAVTAWMGFFALVYVFAGEAIAGAFVDDAAVIAAAAASFTLFGLMQVADGVQSVALGALRGMLDNRWPTVVSLIAYWLLALPLAWTIAVVLGYGPPGIWAGYGVGLACAAIALALRFRNRARLAAGPESY